MSVYAKMIFAWFFVFWIGVSSAEMTEAEKKIAADPDLTEVSLKFVYAIVTKATAVFERKIENFRFNSDKFR